MLVGTMKNRLYEAHQTHIDTHSHTQTHPCQFEPPYLIAHFSTSLVFCFPPTFPFLKYIEVGMIKRIIAYLRVYEDEVRPISTR